MSNTETLGGMLNVLCPMHLLLDEEGIVRNAGPAFFKLRPREEIVGFFFLDLFELVRPYAIKTLPQLTANVGRKMHLRFRNGTQTDLKGVLVPAPGSATIVNLSFGISVLDAVRDYDLTHADFAVTDLTVEMLYLVEANAAVMNAFRTMNNRLQGAKLAAEEQASTDTLTGLKNRRAMDSILERLISLNEPFALMHLDLDHFKAINDTMGHAAGDHVLKQVAEIMEEEVREEDSVARVGGDEFVLIFHRLQDRKMLSNIGERLIARLNTPIPFEDKICNISCSIGTVLSGDYATPEASELLHHADMALYASKNAGRASHTFYEPSIDGSISSGTT